MERVIVSDTSINLTAGENGRKGQLPEVDPGVRNALTGAVPDVLEGHHWGDMGGDGAEAHLMTDTGETQPTEVDLRYYQTPKGLGPLTTDDKGNTVIPHEWYATMVSM